MIKINFTANLDYNITVDNYDTSTNNIVHMIASQVQI